MDLELDLNTHNIKILNLLLNFEFYYYITNVYCTRYTGNTKIKIKIIQYYTENNIFWGLCKVFGTSI